MEQRINQMHSSNDKTFLKYIDLIESQIACKPERLCIYQRDTHYLAVNFIQMFPFI